MGQTDKGQTDDTTVENQGLLDLELKPKKEADIPCFEGRKCYWFADCYIGCQMSLL